jgi:hypothetical protein
MISQSPRRMVLFLNEIFYVISLSGISLSTNITTYVVQSGELPLGVYFWDIHFPFPLYDHCSHFCFLFHNSPIDRKLNQKTIASTTSYYWKCDLNMLRRIDWEMIQNSSDCTWKLSYPPANEMVLKLSQLWFTHRYRDGTGVHQVLLLIETIWVY